MQYNRILITWLSLVLGFSFSAYGIEHKEAMVQGVVNAEIVNEEQGKPGPFGPNDGSGGGKPKLADFAQSEYSSNETDVDPNQVGKGEPGPKGPNDGGGNPKLIEISQTSPPKPGPNDGGGGGGKLMDLGQEEKYFLNEDDGPMVLAQRTPPKAAGGPNSGAGKKDKEGG